MFITLPLLKINSREEIRLGLSHVTLMLYILLNPLDQSVHYIDRRVYSLV
jgi:hypothetical protein